MSWEGEVCLLKDVETRTFMTQQDSVVQILSAQGSSLFIFVTTLTDTVLSQLETDGVFELIS